MTVRTISAGESVRVRSGTRVYLECCSCSRRLEFRTGTFGQPSKPIRVPACACGGTLARINVQEEASS